MATDRCVECGYPKDRHNSETLACPSRNKKYSTMALPEGYTCLECDNFRRFCSPIIGLKGAETSCDYFPVRFVLIVPARKGAGQ